MIMAAVTGFMLVVCGFIIGFCCYLLIVRRIPSMQAKVNAEINRLHDTKTQDEKS